MYVSSHGLRFILIGTAGNRKSANGKAGSLCERCENSEVWLDVRGIPFDN